MTKDLPEIIEKTEINRLWWNERVAPHVDALPYKIAKPL